MVKGDGGNLMVADPDPKGLRGAAGATPASALIWDRRYREGRDGWELGQPAPPMRDFFSHHPLAPKASSRNRPEQEGMEAKIQGRESFDEITRKSEVLNNF